MESGIHTIGEAAWQHCNRLLIVRLPSTVVCLQDGAFRRNYALHTVEAPGCKYFGLWVFEECYASALIGDQRTTVNQLAPQARFRPRAFEKCSALQQLNFERAEYDPANLNRDIPEGCFFEAGIESLFLQLFLTGWVQRHASIVKGCGQLISHKPKSVKFWEVPLHTAHSCSSSDWPKQ